MSLGQHIHSERIQFSLQRTIPHYIPPSQTQWYTTLDFICNTFFRRDANEATSHYNATLHIIPIDNTAHTTDLATLRQPRYFHVSIIVLVTTSEALQFRKRKPLHMLTNRAQISRVRQEIQTQPQDCAQTIPNSHTAPPLAIQDCDTLLCFNCHISPSLALP